MVIRIQKSIDSNKYVLGLFLDLRRAFEMVDHKVLLYKLECAGVRGIRMEWFQNYLKDRTQYVNCNEVARDILGVTSGVPQGSVLGPYLFLIYINDLTLLPLSGEITLFADDTSLLYHGSSLEEIQGRVQHDLDLIRGWLSKNKLSLNFDKSNYVLFRKRGLAWAPLDINFAG